MIKKDDLCKKITELYPDIGQCGIDVDVDYDTKNKRWVVYLNREHTTLKTFLEPGDAEFCLMGKQCVSLGLEINQLRDNIERRPA